MKHLLAGIALFSLLNVSTLGAQQEEVQVVVPSARLRATASSQSSLIATLPKGTKLGVLGRDGSWLYVSYGDKRGFISSSLVIPSAANTTATPTPAKPSQNAPASRTPAPSPAPTPPPVQQQPAPAEAAVWEDRPSRKEPGTATLVSILVTGGGQMYAGDTKRGLMMLGGSVGAIVVGTALSGGVSCGDYSCSAGSYTPLYLGALAAVGIWVYSIVDAAPTARRMNQRNGFRVSGLTPTVRSWGTGTTQIGIQLTF